MAVLPIGNLNSIAVSTLSPCVSSQGWTDPFLLLPTIYLFWSTKLAESSYRAFLHSQKEDKFGSDIHLNQYRIQGMSDML